MKNKIEIESNAIDLLSANAPHELEIYNRWRECIDYYVAGYNAAISENKNSSKK
mgnify:CR=1 FL=1